MKQEHTLSCEVARHLRIRGYVTLDCDVMSALKYLPKKDDRNRAMFVKSRKYMGYTLGQSDMVVINKYGNVSFLELKNGKTGQQSQSQKYFEQEIKCRGGNYVLIRDLNDLMDFVKRDCHASLAMTTSAKVAENKDMADNGGVRVCCPPSKANTATFLKGQ